MTRIIKWKLENIWKAKRYLQCNYMLSKQTAIVVFKPFEATGIKWVQNPVFKKREKGVMS